MGGGQEEQSHFGVWRFVMRWAQVEQRFDGQHKAKTDSNAPPTSTITGRLYQKLKRLASHKMGDEASVSKTRGPTESCERRRAEASQSSLEVNLAALL